MKVAIIGSGYVGLVTAACFAEWGWQVMGVDKDAAKVAMLQGGGIPIYEPGLDALVAHGMQTGKLRFTTDMASAVEGAECVFIAVGTPTEEGSERADLRAFFGAAEEVARVAKGYALLVNKSTVPVGTAEALRAHLKGLGVTAELEVASNPEFLREGSALEDFLHPDRVVIGTQSDRARALLEKLYSPVTRLGVPLVSTDSATAELIKYASNGFLATKIAFINQMADIAEKVGADVTKVALGMGLDHRISPHFLLPGPGYGGSCFPKDTRALASIARDAGAPASIIEEVIAANDTRKNAMVARIVSACGGSVQGKRIGVWGLAFKANTDDMRESPSLVILPALLAKGAQITACDPAAILPAKPLLPKEIVYSEDALATAEKADVLVILTEWPAFRSVDLEKLRATMKKPIIVDCRNLLDAERLRELGFTYYAIGREPIAG